MTYRSRDEILAVSEEYSHCHPPEPFLFSKPSEVDLWNQSVPCEVELPLTPPDTASECAPSDCPEMTSQSWSQHMPEEWAQQNHRIPMTQSYEREWTGQVPSALESYAMDSTNWMTASTNGSSVDLGLSPVLSYESQSSHTLNSSESDLPLLPTRLDFSFAAGDPAWSQTQTVGQYAPHGWQQPLSGNVHVSSPAVYSQADQTQTYYPSWNTPQDVPYGGPIFQASCSQRMPGMNQRTAVARQPVVHQRPLLPRTERSAVSSQPAYTAPQRMLLPHTLGNTSYVPSVSSTAVQPREVTHYRPIQPLVTESHTPETGRAQTTAPEAAHLYEDSSIGSSAEIFQDSAAEDFSAFIQYDPDDQPLSPGTSSHATAQGSGNAVHTDVASPVDVKPKVPGTGYQAEHARQSRQSSGARLNVSVSSDVDEGRHRNHPLYSKGPSPDGLYHCPWKDEPEKCQHKPTKLKCNYEYAPTQLLQQPQPHDTDHQHVYSKFVDSHLKPFRCKIETCSKQEFSSTACLLRHEREAHGMHGHGDRPHLCYYAGCERAAPRNGFPRRYNLFDHMKRVHDHKEEPTPSAGSPEVAPMEKKASGRKRKATASVPAEPAAHRQRITVLPPQQIPQEMPYLPQGNYSHAQMSAQYTQAQQMPVCPHQQQRQSVAYSEWDTQRDLVSRQMEFVRPDDDAGLQNLSQNVAELRRLSQEAQKG